MIDPLDLIGVYGADAVRFWCARAVSFGQDGNVTLESFHERYERELANELGNLVSRTTAMISRYRGGVLVKSPGSGVFDADALRLAIIDHLDRFDISGALEEIWERVSKPQPARRGERALGTCEGRERRPRSSTAFSTTSSTGCTPLAVALAAYLPETAPKILEALAAATRPVVRPGSPRSGRRDRRGIGPAPPLFPRVDTATTAA